VEMVRVLTLGGAAISTKIVLMAQMKQIAVSMQLSHFYSFNKFCVFYVLYASFFVLNVCLADCCLQSVRNRLTFNFTCFVFFAFELILFDSCFSVAK